MCSSDLSGPGGRAGCGEGDIFFGPASAWPKRQLDLLVDAPDVRIYGADGKADNFGFEGDRLGFQPSSSLIAQLVGDPIPDLIVGAEYGAGIGNDVFQAGEVYVLRGRPIWPSVIDLRVPGSADLVVYGR